VRLWVQSPVPQKRKGEEGKKEEGRKGGREGAKQDGRKGEGSEVKGKENYIKVSFPLSLSSLYLPSHIPSLLSSLLFSLSFFFL
jgi:hypothetical protein